MPLSSASYFVDALLDELPDTSPAVIVVKPERPRSPRPTKVDPNRPSYNPGIVYILELATSITLRDDQTIQELGERVTAVLQNIVRDAKSLHPLTLTRVVNYLLNLLRRTYVCSAPIAVVARQTVNAM